MKNQEILNHLQPFFDQLKKENEPPKENNDEVEELKRQLEAQKAENEKQRKDHEESNKSLTTKIAEALGIKKKEKKELTIDEQIALLQEQKAKENKPSDPKEPTEPKDVKSENPEIQAYIKQQIEVNKALAKELKEVRESQTLQSAKDEHAEVMAELDTMGLKSPEEKDHFLQLFEKMQDEADLPEGEDFDITPDQEKRLIRQAKQLAAISQEHAKENQQEDLYDRFKRGNDRGGPIKNITLDAFNRLNLVQKQELYDADPILYKQLQKAWMAKTGYQKVQVQ